MTLTATSIIRVRRNDECSYMLAFSVRGSLKKPTFFLQEANQQGVCIKVSHTESRDRNKSKMHANMMKDADSCQCSEGITEHTDSSETMREADNLLLL